jgi:transposase
MKDYKGFLTTEQRFAIIKVHRNEINARYADRLKSVLLLDSGYSFEQIAKILLIDDQSVRNYLARFEKNSIEGLLADKYLGYGGLLTQEEKDKLSKHLEEFTYLDATPIIEYIEFEFGKKYTPSGVCYLLHSLDFVYKKASRVPGKADIEKQQKFLDGINEILKHKSSDTPVLYMDAVHPQHNSMPAYGWIKKGERKEVQTNTGRERININGALNAETKEVIVVETDTINAEATIKLFEKIEAHYPSAPYIYIFSDNAKYYYSEEVAKYLKTSRIFLEPIPAYSPNLNLIERLWKFFHKKIHYNRYDKTFAEFRLECLMFFERLDEYAESLETLLTLKFKLTNGKNATLKTA